LNQEIQSDTDVSKCLFIGDTLTDYEAASAFEVPFLLRETEDNKKLFMSYTGLLFNDFQTLNE
jgi:phosphoglycolate phosphatase-like HAD superfamily hydrolase